MNQSFCPISFEPQTQFFHDETIIENLNWTSEAYSVSSPLIADINDAYPCW